VSQVGGRGGQIDDNKSAYCIYDDDAGKAELNIFYPARDTLAEGQNAQSAAQSARGGKFESVRVAGPMKQALMPLHQKGSDSASTVVRKGTTVFNISIPQSAQAGQQLVKLSEIVISRLKQ
jgi:hypothetical protein